ncbi:hypothetical protein CU097_002491, partial [Rhizopus azygosporus]
MATAVIRDAGSTVLAQQQVQELYDSINKSSNVKSLLGSILNLFCEVNTIEIINNDKLNEISEQLTRLLATYLSSRNKNFEAPFWLLVSEFLVSESLTDFSQPSNFFA